MNPTNSIDAGNASNLNKLKSPTLETTENSDLKKPKSLAQGFIKYPQVKLIHAWPDSSNY